MSKPGGLLRCFFFTPDLLPAESFWHPSFLEAPQQDVAMEVEKEGLGEEGDKAWGLVSITFFCKFHSLYLLYPFMWKFQRVKHKKMYVWPVCRGGLQEPQLLPPFA